MGSGIAGAFLWDEAHRTRDLASVFSSEHGLDLTGWSLSEAIGISSDGNVIAGNGTREGHRLGWVVTLQTPAPYSGRPPCQGDVDGNRVVSLTDLALVLSEFRLPGGTSSYDCTGDGVVDALDVDIVMHDLGQRCRRVQQKALP